MYFLAMNDGVEITLQSGFGEKAIVEAQKIVDEIPNPCAGTIFELLEDMDAPIIFAGIVSSPTLNLTQHPASKEQIEAGVEDVENRARLKELLTFNASALSVEPPHIVRTILKERARNVIKLSKNYKRVMIGGAQFFMSYLIEGLKENETIPFYALTERVASEVTLPDGTTKKVSEFMHVGFTEAR